MVVANDIDLSAPVELAPLSVKDRAVRCRVLASGHLITIRAQSFWKMVLAVFGQAFHSQQLENAPTRTRTWDPRIMRENWKGAVSSFLGDGAHFFVHRFHRCPPLPYRCVEFA